MWVGRYRDDDPVPVRAFHGSIETGKDRTIVVSVEARGLDTLRGLRTQPGWPHEPKWHEGRCKSVPKKALGHASITVLRPAHVTAEHGRVRIRWAVFLPLDDDSAPRDNSVVETLGSVSAVDGWEIILHGYFWPSQDRRSIPGVTDSDSGTGENEVRLRWNRAVRDELLLPCVPSVLALAVNGLPKRVAWELLRGVAGSRVVRSNLAAVTLRYLLLPVITEEGIRWDALGIDTPLLLPEWSQAPIAVRKALLTQASQHDREFVFIETDAPRIGGSPDEWPACWLDRLLRCIVIQDLQAAQELSWISHFLRQVLGNEVRSDDERAVIPARWLAERIAEGALAPTTAATTPEREQLRMAWRELFERLPRIWLLEVPLECQTAVLELAAEGIVGERFLPIPLGRRAGSLNPLQIDPERLDKALSYLGQQLQFTEGVSQRGQRS